VRVREGGKVNKIKSGFFAFCEVTAPLDHVAYNVWHSFDHIPENLALNGVVLGVRWSAPRTYMEARFSKDPDLAANQYLVHYLMTEPLKEVIAEFVDIGTRLRDLGRFYADRDILYAGHHRFVESYVPAHSVISPEALPFCPHRGVYVLMADVVDQESEKEVAQWINDILIPEMIAVDDVLGTEWFKINEPSDVTFKFEGYSRYVLLTYLSGEPLELSARLRKRIEDAKSDLANRGLGEALRIVFAGPYKVIEHPEDYDWNKD
jgi:hypothetical protein